MSVDLKTVAINALLILGTILVLYVMLRMFVYNPLRKIMSARTESIRGQMEQARAASAEANAMRDRLEWEMQEKTDLAAEIIADSEREAKLRASEIIRVSQERADGIIREGRARAEEERIAAIARLREEIADMAIQIAMKVLEREVSAADNRHLIDEYFRRVS